MGVVAARAEATREYSRASAAAEQNGLRLHLFFIVVARVTAWRLACKRAGTISFKQSTKGMFGAIIDLGT